MSADYAHDELVKATLDKISQERLVQLLCRLIDTPSPTGDEAACVEKLAEVLTEAGLKVEIQRFHGQRANLIATLEGPKEGLSLMMCGHLDTTGYGDPSIDRASLGSTGPADRPEAFVKDGIVYGLGAYNMKGGVAAAAEALIALRDAGVPLAGTVTLGAVAGESEKAPISGLLRDFTGHAYEGSGVGARWLLTHSRRPDAVIICEPCDCYVLNAQPGFLLVKVSVRGRPLYQSSRVRNTSERSSLQLGCRVVDALSEWQTDYQERYKLWSGIATLYPNVAISAIEAGWPFMPAIWPGVCNIYVDVRIPPQVDANDVLRELDAVVQEAIEPARSEIDVYANTTPGALIPLEHPLVQHTLAAREAELGMQSDVPDAGLNAGDDGKLFADYGIPYVTCGPGAVGDQILKWSSDANLYGKEWVEIDQLTAAARIYTRVALSMTSVSRAEMQGWPSVRPGQ